MTPTWGIGILSIGLALFLWAAWAFMLPPMMRLARELWSSYGAWWQRWTRERGGRTEDEDDV